MINRLAKNGGELVEKDGVFHGCLNRFLKEMEKTLSQLDSKEAARDWVLNVLNPPYKGRSQILREVKAAIEWLRRRYIGEFAIEGFVNDDLEKVVKDTGGLVSKPDLVHCCLILYMDETEKIFTEIRNRVES